MNDNKLYIDRDSLLNNTAIRQYIQFHTGETKPEEWVISGYDLANFPTIEAQPIVKGEWVWDENGMDWGLGAWKCSNCRAMPPAWWNADKTNPRTRAGHKFCPNCGADMRD